MRIYTLCDKWFVCLTKKLNLNWLQSRWNCHYSRSLRLEFRSKLHLNRSTFTRNQWVVSIDSLFEIFHYNARNPLLVYVCRIQCYIKTWDWASLSDVHIVNVIDVIKFAAAASAHPFVILSRVTPRHKLLELSLSLFGVSAIIYPLNNRF